MNATPWRGRPRPSSGEPGEPEEPREPEESGGPGRSDASEESGRRELAELLPPPAVPGLGADRQLLLREQVLRRAAASAEPPGRRSAPRAPFRRPARFRIAVPALACALAVAGVLAVDLGGAGTAGRDRTVAQGGAAVTSEAARLLDRIALAAAAGPEQPTVGADRFVFIESRVAYAAQSAAGGPVALAPAHTRQVWLSADGSRPGLLREEGGPDTRLGEDGPVLLLDRPGASPRPDASRGSGPSIGEPTHAYVASLPTDPDALLRLIREQTGGAGQAGAGRGGAGQDPDQRAFAAIGNLLAETWAPPRVSASLYRAAERIPGVTVVPSAGDAAGREGVAVARTAHGRQTQWVFDRTTYAFLGERTVLSEAGEAGPAGTVVGTSAVLVKGAVDRVGELPRAAG
ncbi:CU044_5270 family protein [Kitasatospora sp. NPDC057738]|uniref:CU044_5270 family protein n=1 Tax=Kitasatospora sp. NPDC057738 TaxID=3346233 RepID=UPI00367E8A3F